MPSFTLTHRFAAAAERLFRIESRRYEDFDRHAGVLHSICEFRSRSRLLLSLYALVMIRRGWLCGLTAGRSADGSSTLFCERSGYAR